MTQKKNKKKQGDVFSAHILKNILHGLLHFKSTTVIANVNTKWNLIFPLNILSQIIFKFLN